MGTGATAACRPDNAGPVRMYKFLACGILEHGFARVCCDPCEHEYLLAFSCKARYFCPSCHAKRLALWTLWLEETLLAAVPHRQVVLTIPKRLRTWCLYLSPRAPRRPGARCRPDRDRRRAHAHARARSRGRRGRVHPDARVARQLASAHSPAGDRRRLSRRWHVRPWPAHDTATLTEAFRRAVLRLFVRRGLFEADDAQGMLAWPHSGFHVHDGVWVPDGDMDFAKRLARYCARNPVALERLAYDGPGAPVHYRSDKRDGPTVGTETVDPSGVSGPPRDAHSEQAPGDDALLRVVRQPAARHAAQGDHGCRRGADNRGRARGAAAPRGRAAVGRALAAHLRSGPAHLSGLWRRDAHSRVPHRTRRDRSDS